MTARDLKERRHPRHHRLWGDMLHRATPQTVGWGDMLHRAAHGWMCFEKGRGKVWCLVKCGGAGRRETVTGNQGWRIVARKGLASPS